jgi:hypothetical protein
MIAKGSIVSTDGTYATIQTYLGEVFDDVLLIYPAGFQSKIKPSESSIALLFCGFGQNNFAIAYDVLSQSTLEEGEVEIRNRVSGLGFKAKQSINEIQGNSNINGTCNATSYKVGDIKVVGTQQPTISNPAGGVIIDAEARAAIISIITALKAHGLIA